MTESAKRKIRGVVVALVVIGIIAAVVAAVMAYEEEQERQSRQNAYSCPLCLKTFPLEALEAYALSVEHVPPQNQGPPFTQVLIRTECAWIWNGE